MKRVNSRFINNRSGSEKGAAAVEMAIALPLFALLLLGVLEFGLMARDHQILQNAAREGARFSALPANRIEDSQNPGAIEQTIRNRVADYLLNEGIVISSGSIDVDQEYPISVGALTLDASRVTINYTRSAFLAGAGELFSLDSIELTADAVFRNFY